MTLTDAGPLIAIIDADEPDHAVCLEALDQVALPLVTTWPRSLKRCTCSAEREESRPSARSGG